MTDDTRKPAGSAPKNRAQTKAEARAAALRANLMKRKQQMRSRTAETDASPAKTQDTQDQKED